MSTQYFWETLLHSLKLKPGIQKPYFEFHNNESFDELKRHTWNTMRIYDKWSDLSSPQFRTRRVVSGVDWVNFEVLPGGKWLFGIVMHGWRACIIDLDKSLDESKPVHHYLFSTTHPEDLFYTEFSLYIKECSSSFRVAVFNNSCEKQGKSSIAPHSLEVSDYRTRKTAHLHLPS
jgi:hypothetical protein